ncbi:MAG: hypothetical protein GC157_01130 [Frankiales bacterium]|nr:hypothetical protein [Frankiales bacterium]
MSTYVTTCSECSVTFESGRSWAKTCSDRCRQRRHRRTHDERRAEAARRLRRLIAETVTAGTAAECEALDAMLDLVGEEAFADSLTALGR